MNKNSTPSKAATQINENPANEIKFLKYVKNSPKFNKLSQEQKQQVLGKVYDKHVGPWLHKQLVASGSPRSIYRLPTKEEWLNEQTSPTQLRTSPEEASHEYAMSAVKGATDMAITANKFVGYMFGHNRLVDKSGPFNVDKTPTGFMDESYRNLKYKEEDYLADHQVNSIGNELVRGGFEMLPQLPLFNFTEGALEGAGLTKEVLATYKAAKPLRAAAVGFLTSLATGSNIKEAAGQGVGFAGFEVGGDALAKLGKAGLSRSKSFLGRMLVLGGPKSIAAMLEAGEKWTLRMGGEDLIKVKIKGRAVGGDPLKLSDPLGQAGANILNSFAKQKFNRLYNFLSKDQKLEVMRGIADFTKTEVPTDAIAQGVISPEVGKVIESRIGNDVAKQAAASPEFKASVDGLAKLGINVVTANAEETMDNAAVKSGRRAGSKVIQHLETGTTKDTEKTQNILQYVNDYAKGIGRPGPGAANINDPIFFENLRHLIGNNYKLESPHQQLVQLWGLRSEFPKSIQALIKHEMEKLYPPEKGYNPRVYNQMVQNQEKLLSDVATGLNKDVEDIKKHGARLFRSHDQAIDPLSGKTPNRFTKELEQKAEAARIKAKVKNNPEAKKAVDKTEEVLRKHNIKGTDNPLIAKEEIGGKTRLGVARARTWDIMGSNLYGNRGPQVVVKELLQNAKDSFLGMMDKVSPKIDVIFNNDNSFTISDNGKGMTPKELNTVFTDLGVTGKEDYEEATGGFGFAKAAIFTVPKKLKVTSVAWDGGKKIESIMEGTKNEFMEGVPLKTRVVPSNTSTGTTIQPFFDESAYLYNARSYVEDFGKSLNLPAELNYYPYGKNEWTKASKLGEDKPNILIADSMTSNAKFKIYKSEKENKMFKHMFGGLPVEINNNGIYQMRTTIPLGNAAGLKGVPARIAVDIKPLVKDVDPDYPFTLNREDLKGPIKDQISKIVRDKIINPAVEEFNQQIGKVYDSIPQIGTGVFYDAGKRLTDEEFNFIKNDPFFKKLNSQISDIMQDVAAHLKKVTGDSDLKYGHKLERAGIVLSDKVHGVSLSKTNHEKRTALVNPFSYEDDDPDIVAAGLWETMTHEINHDTIGEHGEAFTSSLNKLHRFIGIDKSIRYKIALKRTLESDTKSFNKIMQMFKDAMTREPKELDIFED